ncbi:MAG: hypothetical protein HQ514_08400 [Rhodospirillales bacterium]|nr:hypothetical protein [Rhodospirillales bacterium]
MTIKSFIIAAATGLSLLAALPASAHQNATPKVQTVNHYKHGYGDRQYIPLRQIFRILRTMERRETRRGDGRRHYGRRHYGHDRRYRNHRRHNQRRSY